MDGSKAPTNNAKADTQGIENDDLEDKKLDHQRYLDAKALEESLQPLYKDCEHSILAATKTFTNIVSTH